MIRRHIMLILLEPLLLRRRDTLSSVPLPRQEAIACCSGLRVVQARAVLLLRRRRRASGRRGQIRVVDALVGFDVVRGLLRRDAIVDEHPAAASDTGRLEWWW